MGKRAGWKASPTIYRLQFEGDPRYDGLEVEAKSLPLGDFFALQELQAKAEADLEAARDVIRRLAEVIVSWNVEDEQGHPVPATFEGVETLELPFVLHIFRAWMQAVAGVPNPSLPASNDGGTFPEQSIPMEVSSVNPPS